MKKYNLSKIMKRAWSLVRKAAMTISNALKAAWAEAKKGAAMRGTEKQVSWAEDIKATFIRTMTEFRELFINSPEYDATNSKHVEVASKFDKNIATINAEEYAGDIIDMFSGINGRADTLKRYQQIVAALTVSANAHKKNYIR